MIWYSPKEFCILSFTPSSSHFFFFFFQFAMPIIPPVSFFWSLCFSVCHPDCLPACMLLIRVSDTSNSRRWHVEHNSFSCCVLISCTDVQTLVSMHWPSCTHVHLSRPTGGSSLIRNPLDWRTQTWPWRKMATEDGKRGWQVQLE